MRRLFKSVLQKAGEPLRHIARRASARFAVPPSSAESYRVDTADGWALQVFRVRRSERPPQGPVLLQHGLAACHLTYLFPGRALAEHLADLGFDVWISNLRGGRFTRRPAAPAPLDWSIHDFVDYDLPAIVARIRAETGAPRVQWVGHSMGGVLLYLYGIRHGGEGLASGVAVASSLDYKVGENGFQTLVRYLPLVAWLPSVPLGIIYQLYSPLVGITKTRLDTFGYYPGNVEPEVVRTYYANVYQNVAPGVFLSLASTFGEHGFCDPTGFSYTRNAHRFTVPVLAIAGDRDPQCAPEAIAATIAAVGSARKEMRVMGPAHGTRMHYGHFDLIVGRHASEEVWPVIARWLTEYAPATRVAGS